jgi:hypothetical protein
MNVLTDTWRGLVQRRLLPVALLLVAAVAAVPFLLAKEEEPVAPLPTAAVEPADDGAAAQPIVAVASSAVREVGRDVVGSRKDPFRPAIAAKKGKAVEAPSAGSGSATPAGSGSSGSTGSTGGGTTAPVTPGTTGGVGITPRKVYEVATIAVRFGPSSAMDREVSNLRRLKALPSVSEPVLIYLGLRNDSKTAVFMVDSGAVVQGDAKCLPSPNNCQTIELQAGETEFIDIESDGKVEQYQLDFVKVRRKKVTDAAIARRAYAAEAAGGRAVLRPRWSRMGRWRYDKRTGRVKQIGDAEYAAAVARAAHRGN